MDLIADAALGVPCTALYEVLKEVVLKAIGFGSLTEEVKSKIAKLKQLIEVVKNRNLLDPETELNGFKEQMQEVERLISACSEVRWWNICKTSKYTDQLSGSTNSLESMDARLNRLLDRDIDRVADRISAIHNRVHGWCAVPIGAPFTVGVEMPLRELKTKLLEDETVRMLVLTAAVGYGKTTLAIKFCEDSIVKDKFKDNIFFVTVSDKSDELVVQELYRSKGLEIHTLCNELDVGKWLKSFVTAVGKKPVLFVLDDVLSGSESLLQNFVVIVKDLPNSKILVTSRIRFPRFGTQHNLEALNVEDATTLFKLAAFQGKAIYDIPERIVKEIVDHYKSSPLAITVVGRSLCKQSVERWQKTASALKGASILDSGSALLQGLQSCLDALNGKDAILKECFLDLGSFPEDQTIHAAALIDMWAELYQLKDFDSIDNLRKLADQSLAYLRITRKEKMQADGFYTEHFVTQHNLLRQLAIYQPELESYKKRRIIDKWGDNLPKCYTEQNDQAIKARLLSISSDGVFSTILHSIELSEVEVLVLNYNKKNYALPEFVEKMDKLKVLIVTNNGVLPAELCNIQLLSSSTSLKRIRLERISISSITKNLVELKSVTKISLFMCNIGQAFNNGSFKISDAFPCLEEMNIDYCNDLVELPAALCALDNLKMLSITNSHKLSALPEEIGGLKNLEILRLRSCTDLTMLPDSFTNLKKLNFLDIADCISIQELPEEFGGMSSLENINMRKCSRLRELPSSVWDLQKLQEVVCDEDTGNLWEPFLSYLPNLHITLVDEDVNLDWLLK